MSERADDAGVAVGNGGAAAPAVVMTSQQRSSAEQAAVTRPLTPRRLAVRRFLRRPAAVVGLAVIALFVAAAVLAPLLAPYDPIATSWSAIRKAPSAAHWMGTDENGRDVLSRVLFGARASLLGGLCRWRSPPGSACRRGCWRGSPAAGSMLCCHGWSTPCWPARS
jgi:hypothetical protein